MRYFDIKKLGALALGLMAIAPAAKAQDKVETTIGADIVSMYYWRGQDLGSISLQPTLGIGYKGFSLKQQDSYRKHTSVPLYFLPTALTLTLHLLEVRHSDGKKLHDNGS